MQRLQTGFPETPLERGTFTINDRPYKQNIDLCANMTSNKKQSHGHMTVAFHFIYDCNHARSRLFSTVCIPCAESRKTVAMFSVSVLMI